MEEEIIALKERMDIKDTKEVAGSVYYSGTMAGKDLILVKSGIGKVNAAVCTQTLVNLFDIDCIINVGVAGGIDKNLEIGDVVISDDAVHHDFDSVIFDLPQGVIPLMDKSFFKAEPSLVALAEEAANTVLCRNKVLIGRVASGDQFIADADTKEKIHKTFGALCTEMEGAAIAHTAHLNSMPYVIIRAISDNADGDAHISFSKFLESSVSNTADIVEYVARKLSEA